MAAELAGGLYEVPGLIPILSSVLERMVGRNDAALRAGGGAAARRRAVSFVGLTRPSVPLRGYLERIFRYACCSPSCYVVAFVYLNRFSALQPDILIDSFSVHRLLITSVLTAVKFLDDIFYNNAYFAKVGGISLMEMNNLEMDFLFGMNFNLNVDPDTFVKYCAILHKEMQIESPPLPPRLQCFLTEEEPSSCQKQQLTV